MDAVKETIADVRSVCLRQSSGEWLTLETSTQLFCHGVYYPHQHTVDTPVCLPPRRRSCPVVLRAGITLISGKWDSPHLSFNNNGTYHENAPEISKLVFARPGDRALFWKLILLSLRLDMEYFGDRVDDTWAAQSCFFEFVCLFLHATYWSHYELLWVKRRHKTHQSSCFPISRGCRPSWVALSSARMSATFCRK